MNNYTLPRTGLPDVAFTGEQLATAGERPPDAKPEWNMRWHELDLYCTEGGVWVAHVRYLSEHEREPEQDLVFTADTLDGLVSQLAEYDPYQWIDRYPDHSKWEQREDRREALICAQFDAACNDAYAQAGVVETLD